MKFSGSFRRITASMWHGGYWGFIKAQNVLGAFPLQVFLGQVCLMFLFTGSHSSTLVVERLVEQTTIC